MEPLDFAAPDGGRPQALTAASHRAARRTQRNPYAS